jgi:cellulose synthase/poly-beta-1,6-N-acetylglucosamine synthase-like glycosyltransferase
MPTSDGEYVFVVPSGTKLSKIRRLAQLVESDLFLICDPDLTVREDGCCAVVSNALKEAAKGSEVVAFGVVEGKNDGTLLSQIIAVDKWFSHRVLRPFLWAAGIGVTLPGQFLLVSASLLRSLDPAVDSYLDDLYLGWVARRRRVRLLRLATVVGEEDARSSWASLLTQRLRWMKGIASLSSHLARHPSALALIGVHYIAYHGLPILWMTLVVLLGCANLLAGVGVVFSLATVLSVLSGRSILACVAFLGVFPLVHVAATLTWWIPVNRSALTRR